MEFEEYNKKLEGKTHGIFYSGELFIRNRLKMIVIKFNT
jgi:hypothetical protein